MGRKIMSLYRKQEDTYKKNIVRFLYVICVDVLIFTYIICNYNEGESTETVKINARADKQITLTQQTTSKADNNKRSAENRLDQKKQADLKDKSNRDGNSNSKDNSQDNSNDNSNGNSKDNSSNDNDQKNLNIKNQIDNVDPKVLDEVNKRLDSLTIEEQICQMFIVSPEELTNYFNVTAAGIKTKRAIERYPVGGVIYFASNIKNENQTKKLLANTNTYATENNGIPMFLCVDEEGGEVTRIASNKNFKVERFDNMTYVTSKKEAYQIGSKIGSYLKDLGFNVDFAPVADVLTNKKNEVVKERSFGKKANKVTDYAYEVAKGLNDQNVYATYKHFPGHGSTSGDSHEGFAITNKTYEQLYQEDFGPFLDGIEKNIDFIMVGHISAPKVIGDNTPSSLSKIMVTDTLRNKLGYEGVIITDAMNMGAISKNYTVEQSTLQAVKAGCDVVLMPSDFRKAYASLVKAVKEGEIPKEQIKESVRRILLLKKRRLTF